MNIQKHKSAGDKWFDFANYTLMVILSVLFLYPFWDLIMLSFTSPAYADSLGFRFYPQGFTWSAYETLFQNDLIYIASRNTLIRTVLGTALTLFVTFFAAYALTKKDLPLRNTITLYIVFTLFFYGGLIPSYLNMKNLGLIDTLWVLTLPFAANAWYIVLARNFLSSFPKELEESAEMDGANPFQAALRIILPLSMPIIAVVALWSAVYHWNAWFDALVYTRDKDNYVLQLLVYKIMIQQQETGNMQMIKLTLETTPQTIKAATIVISIAPILVAYPFVQKYFVKGIMVGSLKG